MDEEAGGGGGAKDLIGVLGGMGPLATVDFMGKVLALTPADRDADHFPMVVSSMPQIPDRVAPILTGAGPSPLADLRRERMFLESAGARCIVMPCNTAHFWYDALTADCSVHFPHMVDATLDALIAGGMSPGPAGIIGTKATQAAGIYQDRLKARGFESLILDEGDMDRWVTPGIALVKKNELRQAEALIRAAIERLLKRGARKVILACTDIPPAFADDDPLLRDHCVDSTEALAGAAVAWGLAQRRGTGAS